MVYVLFIKISTKFDTWPSRNDCANFSHFHRFSVFFIHCVLLCAIVGNQIGFSSIFPSERYYVYIFSS